MGKNKAWKPKIGGKYWYICSLTEDVRLAKHSENFVSILIVYFGDCFKTKSEAESVLKKIRGMR